MGTLIKEITNITDEGVSFNLTKKASINNGGLSTDKWFVSWDKIGKCLFNDQYSNNVTVKSLNIERKKL